jgi:hypothetical protein
MEVTDMPCSFFITIGSVQRPVTLFPCCLIFIHFANRVQMLDSAMSIFPNTWAMSIVENALPITNLMVTETAPNIWTLFHTLMGTPSRTIHCRWQIISTSVFSGISKLICASIISLKQSQPVCLLYYKDGLCSLPSMWVKMVTKIGVWSDVRSRHDSTVWRDDVSCCFSLLYKVLFLL